MQPELLTERFAVLIDTIQHYGGKRTYEELAELLECEKSSFTHYKKGRNRPTFLNLLKIFLTFPRVNPYYLFDPADTSPIVHRAEDVPYVTTLQQRNQLFSKKERMTHAVELTTTLPERVLFLQNFLPLLGDHTLSRNGFYSKLQNATYPHLPELRTAIMQAYRQLTHYTGYLPCYSKQQQELLQIEMQTILGITEAKRAQEQLYNLDFTALLTLVSYYLSREALPHMHFNIYWLLCNLGNPFVSLQQLQPQASEQTSTHPQSTQEHVNSTAQKEEHTPPQPPAISINQEEPAHRKQEHVNSTPSLPPVEEPTIQAPTPKQQQKNTPFLPAFPYPAELRFLIEGNTYLVYRLVAKEEAQEL